MAEYSENRWTMSEYYQLVERAIRNEKADELCRLLTIDLSHRPSFIRLTLQHSSTSNNNTIIDPSWCTIVDCHFRCVRNMHRSQYQEAFNEKYVSNNELYKLLQLQKDSNWCVPFMNRHSVELRLLAIKADAEAEIRRHAQLERFKIEGPNAKVEGKIMKKDENMERACECLMHLFRICATDVRTAIANSKRLGMIYIINQLFKIYFRINKLHLCKPLIRALDNASIFNYCSMAQKVTYNYYLGVKTLFDLKIKEAERSLDFVFANCHPESRKNMRLTLIFLIPIKMLLGRMPTKELMDKYNLRQFDNIKKAVVAGRIGELDEAIETHSDFFWRYGIYLIIERLRPIALRNLFKKVAKCANSHQIDMNLILNAVKIAQPNEDVKMEDVHCMLSNLIYEGKIKGYLSIQHQKLVLSKMNPFPPIV